MAADDSDLCTIADVKTFLNMKPEGGSDDARLQQLVTAVSDDARDLVGRVWTEDLYEETFDGRGHCKHFVKEWPIKSVAKLTVAGQAIPPAPSDTAAGYSVSADRKSIELRGYAFTRGALVRLQHVGGFNDDDFPPRLKQAVVETVAYRFKDSLRTGENSKTLGQEVSTYQKTDFPLAARRALERFGAPGVA